VQAGGWGGAGFLGDVFEGGGGAAVGAYRGVALVLVGERRVWHLGGSDFLVIPDGFLRFYGRSTVWRSRFGWGRWCGIARFAVWAVAEDVAEQALRRHRPEIGKVE